MVSSGVRAPMTVRAVRFHSILSAKGGNEIYESNPPLGRTTGRGNATMHEPQRKIRFTCLGRKVRSIAEAWEGYYRQFKKPDGECKENTSMTGK